MKSSRKKTSRGPATRPADRHRHAEMASYQAAELLDCSRPSPT
jgi:hypothetical protein